MCLCHRLWCHLSDWASSSAKKSCSQIVWSENHLKQVSYLWLVPKSVQPLVYILHSKHFVWFHNEQLSEWRRDSQRENVLFTSVEFHSGTVVCFHILVSAVTKTEGQLECHSYPTAQAPGEKLVLEVEHKHVEPPSTLEPVSTSYHTS